MPVISERLEVGEMNDVRIICKEKKTNFPTCHYDFSYSECNKKNVPMIFSLVSIDELA